MLFEHVEIHIQNPWWLCDSAVPGAAACLLRLAAYYVVSSNLVHSRWHGPSAGYRVAVSAGRSLHSRAAFCARRICHQPLLALLYRTICWQHLSHSNALKVWLGPFLGYRVGALIGASTHSLAGCTVWRMGHQPRWFLRYCWHCTISRHFRLCYCIVEIHPVFLDRHSTCRPWQGPGKACGQIVGPDCTSATMWVEGEIAGCTLGRMTCYLIAAWFVTTPPHFTVPSSHTFTPHAITTTPYSEQSCWLHRVWEVGRRVPLHSSTGMVHKGCRNWAQWKFIATFVTHLSMGWWQHEFFLLSLGFNGQGPSVSPVGTGSVPIGPRCRGPRRVSKQCWHLDTLNMTSWGRFAGFCEYWQT